MGRSFSVYLFCLAMDPLFTYLNRIPGVLSVQGYIDDTTIAGDAQCLEWLDNVSKCYSSLRSAGFIVDSHGCFRACVTIRNRMPPSWCLSDVVDSTWPGLISWLLMVGETCHQSADPAASGQRRCVAGVFSYQQILDIRAGLHMHRLGAYATIVCRLQVQEQVQ